MGGNTPEAARRDEAAATARNKDLQETTPTRRSTRMTKKPERLQLKTRGKFHDDGGRPG